jgi:hypothetical protein
VSPGPTSSPLVNESGRCVVFGVRRSGLRALGTIYFLPVYWVVI